MHLDHLPGTLFGPSTLVELLRHRARHQAEDLAYKFLVDGENDQIDVTYGELDCQARRIGAWLESRELGGERALLLYPPGLEFIAAFFGCLYAGVVAVPVYPPRRNRSMDRIQSIAADAEAKVALTTDTVLSRLFPVDDAGPLIDEMPHLKKLTWLATCHIPEGMEQDWCMPDVHGDTLAFLQYTSGSTGTPKGVILNHANLNHNSALIAYGFEHSRSTAGVFWLPSYHDMGLIGGILQPMHIGRPSILMSPMTFLQRPFRWLSTISRFRATTSGGPNFAYDLCVKKITPEQRETLDLSSWQVAFNGAEPVRKETLDRFAETFAPCGFRREAFYPCYGLAEATLIVSGGYAKKAPVIRSFDMTALTHGKAIVAEPLDEDARELIGCGRALLDHKIEIVDPDTAVPRPDGRVGEIWVSGLSVAQGYWRQPEITQEIFKARLADNGEDLFLRTGDLGFMYDGELFVTGRLKDLIIVHGVNHYPQDVELTVQHSHRRLRKDCGGVFTVEVDSVEGGTAEILVLVQEVDRRKQKGDLAAMYDKIRRAVAAGHDLMLDAIVLVKAGSIPKTSSGKIQRHACRSGFLDGSLSVVDQWTAASIAVDTPAEIELVPTSPQRDGGPKSPTAEKTTEVVLEEIQRVAKGRAAGLTLDTPIIETGLDSLERMEVLALLEDRYGAHFPQEIFPDLQTARDLIEAVEKHLGTEPVSRTARPAGEDISPETYRFEQFPEYVQLRDNLAILQSPEVGNPFFSVHEGLSGATTVIDGHELINFSSFNYSGMAVEPVVMQAAKDAIDKYGASVSASRLVSGEKDLHGQLEQAISRFIGTEDAVTFVSGHATNESVIGHLLSPGDLILHDGLAHNSIVQGSILSGARRRPFTHNSWEAVDQLLSQIRHDYRRVLVVIEGVYSMDGDIPDLPKFIEVKERHKALLMIDEAHSVGVLGSGGRGIGEYFDVAPADVDIWMGTLSKSIGSCGGYIAGCKALIQYLRYTTPTFVFSCGLAPAAAAGAMAAIELMEADPGRFNRLRENAELFLSLVQQRGMNTGTSKDTPVVPIILGSSVDCLQMCKRMFARGVNVQPILHPAVEESASRLRFFVTSLHTEQQIRFTVDALTEELEKINPDYLGQPSSGQTASN